VTHPILDCFTSYGTQLFQPWSDNRIAWDTISVVDPLYTVPFLVCLVWASFYRKDRKIRRVLNTAGLCMGALYMALTFVHKARINTVLDHSLTTMNIDAIRASTNPSIFTNELWTAVAETDSAFY